MADLGAASDGGRKGMGASSDPDRKALVALLDEALRAASRSEAPPNPERHDWVYGSIGFTEPDQHGWFSWILPKVWMPKALFFWQVAVWSGGTVTKEQARDPDHSLARWPEVDKAVGDYLEAAPWLGS